MKAPIPPTWRTLIEPRLRQLGAALRAIFKPTKATPPPAPARPLTEGQEALCVAEFRAEVILAVEQHKAKAAKGGEQADVGVLLADLSRWIDAFVKWKMPDAPTAERRPLMERLQLELAGMVAAAWWPKPAPAPKLAPDGRRYCIIRSADEQTRIDELHRSIGAALARNLNAAVLAQDEPPAPIELPAERPPRVELFDYEGMPCSLGMPGMAFSLCWDANPPRVFDPDSMRRNGAPIDWPTFRRLVAFERSRRDSDFQAFLVRATERPADEDGGQFELPW